MKKTILTLMISSSMAALLLTGCHLDDHEIPKKTDIIPVAEVTAVSSIAAIAYDWANIDTSKQPLVAFPHIIIPEGMMVISSKEGNVSNITKMYNASTLKFPANTGTEVFTANGKLAYLELAMVDNAAQFDAQSFEQTTDEYMQSIGAVPLSNAKLSAIELENLNQISDGISHLDYMQGDVDTFKLRQYALNNDSGKIVYQLVNDDSRGQIGVLQLDGFKTNNSKPTAESMKGDIDKTGMTILNVKFNSGKASLEDSHLITVNEVNRLLKENPELKISIEGHTDNTGNADKNKVLSKERAEKVQYMLLELGVDSSRLKSTGLGDAKPLVSNDTAQNRAINRRVELIKF